MSLWNHYVCEECFKRLRPDREPVRVMDKETAPCCFCGNEHSSGIYYRSDPKETPCKGAGPVHEETIQ